MTRYSSDVVTEMLCGFPVAITANQSTVLGRWHDLIISSQVPPAIVIFSSQAPNRAMQVIHPTGMFKTTRYIPTLAIVYSRVDGSKLNIRSGKWLNTHEHCWFLMSMNLDGQSRDVQNWVWCIQIDSWSPCMGFLFVILVRCKPKDCTSCQVFHGRPRSHCTWFGGPNADGSRGSARGSDCCCTDFGKVPLEYLCFIIILKSNNVLSKDKVLFDHE